MNISATPRPEQLKALIYKVTENKRLIFQGYGERIFKKALNAQFLSALKGIRVLGYSILPIVDQYVPRRPIEEAFIQVYGRVGALFASETFGGIKSYHPNYEVKRRRRRRFVQAETLESTWLAYMRRFALTEAGERIVGITNTTQDIVRRSLDKSITDGLGIDEAARNLVKEWKGISKTRAKVIARTEIVSSSNAGSFVGAQSTGLDLEKEWLSTRDSRTRDTHRSADGQKRLMGDSFSIGGYSMEYPGAPGAPASQTINCRCTIVYNVLE